MKSDFSSAGFSEGQCRKRHECNQSFPDVDVKSEVQNEWGKYGQHELVGRGKVTNPDKCGRFSLWGCLGEDGSHDFVTLDGKNRYH